MKKICACAFTVMLLLAGCKKTSAPAAKQEQVPVQETPASAPETKVEMINSVMIAGGFWRLTDEDTMKWVEYAVPGTRVQAYGSSDPSSGDRAETKRQVVRTTDNQKRDFIHIEFEGHDYWAQDYSIVVDATPAVVVGGNAFIFTKPSPDAMGDKKLDFGTVIGVINDGVDTASSPYADKYVKANAYVNSRLIEGAYLAKDSISITANTLLAMQIANKLTEKDSKGESVLTDPVARKDLFETALSFELPDMMQDMFLDLLEKEYAEVDPEDWLN